MGGLSKKKIQKAATYALLSLVTLAMTLPLIWLVSASFQGPGQIYQVPFHWIPETWQFQNFAEAWKLGNMGHAFYSSACISVLYITLHVTCCSIIGYVFAKYQFRFKKLFFMLILITMMIPQELTFFPVYGIVKNLKLVDTYPGVVLPFVISGFGIFFMKQFSAYIPNEILEAARIDGCGNVKMFVKIGLPLLKPALSALTILAFSFIWDEYAWSKLVLNSKEKMSIPVTLTIMAISPTNEVKISQLLAASTIAMVPVIILFAIFQKQFIESITQSGVKG